MRKTPPRLIAESTLLYGVVGSASGFDVMVLSMMVLYPIVLFDWVRFVKRRLVQFWLEYHLENHILVKEDGYFPGTQQEYETAITALQNLIDELKADSISDKRLNKLYEIMEKSQFER